MSFPLNFSEPYIESTGKRTTLGAKLDDSGSQYTLPTASAQVKGGVKIGSHLSMDGETLNADSIGTPDYENNVLIVGTYENFKYYIPMNKSYVGSGLLGYEIKTNPGSTSTTAKIDVYQIIIEDGNIIETLFIKTLVHNGDKTYTDDNISITYTNQWVATLSTAMKDFTTNENVVSPTSWAYTVNVDYKWYIPQS